MGPIILYSWITYSSWNRTNPTPRQGNEGAVVRSQTCGITLHVQQHPHAGGCMPCDVAMQQPHTWIIGAKAEDGVTAAGNLHSVTVDGTGEVKRLRARL